MTMVASSGSSDSLPYDGTTHDHEEGDELKIVVEEVWPTFQFHQQQQSLESCPKIHSLYYSNGYPQDDTTCSDDGDDGGDNNDEKDDEQYRSFRPTHQALNLWMVPETDLTPLDMTYGKSNNTSVEDDDNYYDGTGGIVWLAAHCWCQILVQKLPSVLQYLQPPPSQHCDIVNHTVEDGLWWL